MRFTALLPAIMGLAASTPVATQGVDTLRVAAVYTIKQQGGGLGRMVDEIVVIQSVSRGGETAWVAERRWHLQDLGEQAFRHQWIDGRTCPALEAAIAGVTDLPPVRFAGPDQKPSGGISDTPAVTLIGPSADGKAGDTLAQIDMAGPISTWWRESGKALEPCWSARMVLIGDGTVPARLSTDDAAAAAGRLPTP